MFVEVDVIACTLVTRFGTTKSIEIQRIHLRTHVNIYHLRMQVGSVFGHVCVSVCLSVCLSVFLFIQAITFEPLNIETSFLVYRYILTISRSSLSIKINASRSRSYDKK